MTAIRQALHRTAEVFVVVVALLAVWQAFVVVVGLPRFIFPPPADVLQYIFAEHQEILRHSVTTLYEVLLGFSLAMACAIPLALAIAASPLAERIVYPLLVVIRAVPTLAIAPILVFMFGFGLLPKVLVVLLMAFFPIVVSLTHGLKSVPIEMILLVRSIHSGWWTSMRRVRLPYSLPHLFAGMKLAITVSVVGAVVAEFIGASGGLGYLSIYGLALQNASLTFAAIIALILMSSGLFILVGLIERAVIPWHVSQRLVQ